MNVAADTAFKIWISHAIECGLSSGQLVSCATCATCATCRMWATAVDERIGSRNDCCCWDSSIGIMSLCIAKERVEIRQKN